MGYDNNFINAEKFILEKLGRSSHELEEKDFHVENIHTFRTRADLLNFVIDLVTTRKKGRPKTKRNND